MENLTKGVANYGPVSSALTDLLESAPNFNFKQTIPSSMQVGVEANRKLRQVAVPVQTTNRFLGMTVIVDTDMPPNQVKMLDRNGGVMKVFEL